MMTDRKKYLSFILIIFLLFNGMCMSSSQTDSVLSCRDNGHTSSVVSISDTTLADQDICTDELTGTGAIYSVRNIMSVRNADERLSLRISLFPVLFSSLIHKDISVFRQLAVTGFYKVIISGAVIISYIHHQDGEKA